MPLLGLLLLAAIPRTAEGQHGEPFPMEELKASALQGDAFAQFYLGLFHEEGRGVGKDMDEALEWYGKAEAQGDSEAQFCLAESCMPMARLGSKT